MTSTSVTSPAARGDVRLFSHHTQFIKAFKLVRFIVRNQFFFQKKKHVFPPWGQLSENVVVLCEEK